MIFKRSCYQNSSPSLIYTISSKNVSISMRIWETLRIVLNILASTFSSSLFSLRIKLPHSWSINILVKIHQFFEKYLRQSLLLSQSLIICYRQQTNKLAAIFLQSSSRCNATTVNKWVISVVPVLTLVWKRKMLLYKKSRKIQFLKKNLNREKNSLYQKRDEEK